MANPGHLEILKQGVEVWNRWREDNPLIEPDLQNTDLSNKVLAQVNFQSADLRGADLSHINLNDAQLGGAYIFGANLYKSHLVNADLNNAHLTDSNLHDSDLSNANLNKAYLNDTELNSARLMETNLSGAKLVNANLFRARLNAANLQDSDLQAVDLRDSDLTKANLINSYLGGVNFTGANLYHTEFNLALINGTIFGDNDLSVAKALDKVRHHGPSIIGIDTLYRSGGNIPESFLRGCGIPDEFITFLPSLINSQQAIQFYSCFISYSSKDEDFAVRLYNDLRNKRVRCWFAPEDLKIGAELRTSIDESIRFHDKLLLVLSERSVKSQWVQQEVETALAKEREQGRTVLFPIRLDDTVMQINTGWPAYLKNTRNIGDFREWNRHDSYQKSFDRLIRDLKAEDKTATS